LRSISELAGADLVDAEPKIAGLPKRARQTELTDSSMVVEAALRAQGVALARWSLVADELALGRLRLLFPKVPPLGTGLSYYLVRPRENLRREAVRAFRDWVLEEAKELALPSSRSRP
jgi:LysR family glycine cleavage system transcriptional activator